MTALLTPVLVGAAGLGTEAGLLFYKHQTLQSAADSAAVSAANAYSNGSSSLTVEAEAVTASYGLVAGANSVSVTVNRPPTSGTHMGTSGAIEVVVQQPQTRLFSAIWSSQLITVSARAVAVAGNGGSGCALSLSGSASSAASTQGTSSVVLNSCNLYVNSSSATALSVGGSSTINALAVDVVGGISGSSHITTTQGISTGASPASDPYAAISFPSFSGCNHTNYSSHTIATINPGVYCGGISLSAGANVVLTPGIYYIDRGSLSVNGGATMTGVGVTLVFTSSTGSSWPTATINGGATVSLTAPTSGTTAGIVIFGDRNMTAGTAFKFNGGASQNLGGAVYVPKAALSFAGGANTGTGCTQLVGDTLSFVGNANLSINCTGYGTQSIGTSATALVE